MTPKRIRFSQDKTPFVTKEQTNMLTQLSDVQAKICFVFDTRSLFWNVPYIIFYTTQTNVLSRSWKKAPTAIRESLSNFMLLFIYGFAVKCLLSFLDHTQLDTDTLGRTPTKEWKSHHLGSYQHNTKQYIRQNPMRLTGFETAISETKPLQNFTWSQKAGGLDKNF